MSSDARIGEVLGGTYRVTRLIGRGGMGAVYEAEHLRLPRRFAVKFLRAESLRMPDVFARFRREAEIASALGHENIAEVVDFHSAGDAPYIVMELLQGEELAARLGRVGRFDVAAAWAILDQTAAALEAAHESHVIHRDLKPQNIFLCLTRERDDFVKVMDFGVSKILDTQSVATQAGTLLGTPAYMSPEQAMGQGDRLDARTDVFSLGTIAYELLAGRRAFEAAHSSATIYRVCNTDPEAISSLRSDVPSAVEHVVRTAMAKLPDDRFPSMAAMRDALREACGQPAASRTQPGNRVAPRPSESLAPTTLGGTASESAARRARVRRTRMAAATLAALASVIGTTVLLRDQRPAPPPTVASTAPPTARPIAVPAAPRVEPTGVQAPVPRPLVTITVGSIPAGATVIHEGRRVGKTPLRFEIPRSDTPTRIQIRRALFLPHTATVVPNGDFSLNVPLLRIPRQ